MKTGIFVLIALFGLMLLPLVLQAEPTSVTPTAQNGVQQLVYVIPIKGPIMDRGLNYFVKRSVEIAKKNKAVLIIFEIDTPGGIVGSGEEYTIGLCNVIDSAAPVPTVAYIAQWAKSAGSLISISADHIVMRDGASIGSAEVIGGEPQHQEKYTAAIKSEFRARAQKKGYPVNLMMAMVDKDMEVWEVKVDGKRDFLTRDEIKNASMQDKEVVEVGLVIAKDKLLDLTARDAVNYGLAMDMKDSKEEVPPLFGIKEFKLKQFTPTWSEHLVMFITSSVVVSILILVGLTAGWMAFKTPGTGLPEAIAVMAFILVFFGQYLVGLAEVTEILIFILGVGLLAVEFFVLPGFGVAGISGIILILASLILAMQDFTIPDVNHAPWQWHILQRNFAVVGTSFLAALVIFILIIAFLPSMPFFSRLILPATEEASAGFTSALISYEGLVGKKGIVLTALRPAGKIRLDDTQETIDVVTDGDFINKNEPVQIDSVEGNRIVVGRAKSEKPRA